VVIPTYNRADLVQRSVQSVLNQTYRDFEIVVVDDGSTDATREAVTQFCDARLRYVRHEANRGVAAARNTGIEAARGECVAFNDSDDEWMPHKLERQMGVLSTVDERVGVVYSDMWRVHGSDGRRRKYYRAQHIMPADGVVHERALGFGIGCYVQTAVIRRECFEKAGMFDEGIAPLEDTEFIMRVSRHYHFYHIAEPLVTQFMLAGSLSQDTEALARSTRRLIDKYRHELPRKTVALYHANMAEQLIVSSWRKLAGGRPAASGRDFSKACWCGLVALRTDCAEAGRLLARRLFAAFQEARERLRHAVGVDSAGGH